MDDNENDQEDRTACQAHAIICDLDVCGGENCRTHLVKHGQKQCPTGISVGPCKSQESDGFIHEVHPPVVCSLHGAPSLMVGNLAAFIPLGTGSCSFLAFFWCLF